jgi:hypothetical protein
MVIMAAAKRHFSSREMQNVFFLVAMLPESHKLLIKLGERTNTRKTISDHFQLVPTFNGLCDIPKCTKVRRESISCRYFQGRSQCRTYLSPLCDIQL